MGAAVVEYRIQHDPDAPAVGLLHQQLQVPVGAEGRVHLGIVPGVVLVDRVRCENGVQIDAVDPQLRQIIQLFTDAGQVPAEPLPVGHRAGGPGDGVGAAGAAAEAVREDLIPDRVPHPLGRGRNVGGVHPGLVEGGGPVPDLLGGGAEAVLPIEPYLAAAVQLEVVAASLVGRAQDRRPPQDLLQMQGRRQLLALAVPYLRTPQDARLKGVAPVQEDPLHLGAGLQAQHQLVRVRSVAPGGLGPVEYSGKIHTRSLRCRISGCQGRSPAAACSRLGSRHSQLGEPTVPGVFIRASAPRPR